MKIAYVISSLEVGGAQTMLLQLLQNNDLESNTIKIFSKTSPRNTFIETEIKKMGIMIEYLNMDKNGKIKSFLLFNKKLKKFDPDIIHSHLDNTFSFLYSMIHNKKLMITIHSWPDRFLNKKTMKLYHWLIHKNLLYVVCCAKCVENAFKKIVNIKEEYISTIYNPVNIEKIKTIDFPEKKNKKFTFLHIGRMTDIKNQKLLLQSFCRVNSNENISYLKIVGEGELKQSLMDLSAELKMDCCVEFMGARENITEIMKECDAFVLTSKSECCPMVFLEAMACGLPIISTNVGGTSEIIGDAGILCDQNITSISNAMLKLIENKELYSKYKIAALERSNLFDIEKIKKEYLITYRNFFNK